MLIIDEKTGENTDQLFIACVTVILFHLVSNALVFRLESLFFLFFFSLQKTMRVNIVYFKKRKKDVKQKEMLTLMGVFSTITKECYEQTATGVE